MNTYTGLHTYICIHLFNDGATWPITQGTNSPWAVMLSWQDSYTSKISYKLSKLDLTGLVLACDQSSSAGLRMQAELQVHTCIFYDLCHPG